MRTYQFSSQDSATPHSGVSYTSTHTHTHTSINTIIYSSPHLHWLILLVSWILPEMPPKSNLFFFLISTLKSIALTTYLYLTTLSFLHSFFLFSSPTDVEAFWEKRRTLICSLLNTQFL